VDKSGYVLFVSFPRALVITLISAWLAFASIWFTPASPVVPFYVYLAGAFTAIVLAGWIRKSRKNLEKWFLVIWLCVILIACLPLRVRPRNLAIIRYIISFLYFAATIASLRITVEIARPLYLETRLKRIARGQGSSLSKGDRDSS